MSKRTKAAPREDTGAGEKRAPNCPAEEHDDTNAECICSGVVYLKRIVHEPLSEGHRKNFDTLLGCGRDGDLALMQCTDVKTGQPVAVICMMAFDGTEYVMTPVAKMFDGNPYEEVLPPT